jgi:hypothetical protein
VVQYLQDVEQRHEESDQLCHNEECGDTFVVRCLHVYGDDGRAAGGVIVDLLAIHYQYLASIRGRLPIHTFGSPSL